MELKTCKKCRKLFYYLKGLEVCPECSMEDLSDILKVEKEKEELLSIKKQTLKATLVNSNQEYDSKLEELKVYLSSHPRENIMNISEALKINPSIIYQWIREEKLEFADECKYAWFSCAKCGTKISNGTLCYNCK